MVYARLANTLKAKLIKNFFKADEHTLEIWNKDHMVVFMNNLQSNFKTIKHTYNAIWQKEADNFFSTIDDFYKYFRLDKQSSVSIAPLNPFDYVVNTSELTSEQWAKKVASWALEG